MSVVLETQPDGNYEPSESEIVEYGKWLGMQLPEDNCFLWIAREGLKAPLPDGWKACKSEKGDLYYFNFKTGTSIWDHPMDDHFRELFRSEKEHPSPKSVANGATAKSDDTPAEETPTSAKKSKKKRGEKEKHSKKNNSAANEVAPELAAVKAPKQLSALQKPASDTNIAEKAGPEFRGTLSRSADDSPNAKPIAAGGGISGLKAIAKLSSPPLSSPNHSKGDDSPAVSPSGSGKKGALKPLAGDDDAEARNVETEKERSRNEMLESLRAYKASLEAEKAKKIAEYNKRHDAALREEQARQQKLSEARINEVKLEFENRTKVEVRKLQQKHENDWKCEKNKLEQELKASLDEFTRSTREQCEIQKEAQTQALREVSTVAVDMRHMSKDFVDAYNAAFAVFLESVSNSRSQFSETTRQKEKLQSEGEESLKRLKEQNERALEAEAEHHRQSIEALKQKNTLDLETLRRSHERELEDVERQHRQTMTQAATARQEQVNFSESLSKLRQEQTLELEKLKSELKMQAQSELKAALDEVAKERRVLTATAAAAAQSTASGTEASSEHANSTPISVSKDRGGSRSYPPPIDPNLLQGTTSDAAYVASVEPGESQRDIKTAVTEALREVFAESPFTLPSPSMTPRASPSRASRASLPLAGLSPRRAVAIPPSYQDQREVIERERQRVAQGRTYVQTQRFALEQRRDDLKRRKHQWKQDVLAAKKEGVRSSSARGQLLNGARLQFEDQSRALGRDEAVLRDSEMWLHMKEQRLMQLEQQVEDQAHAGGDGYSLDASALATGFFKPHRYSVGTVADRRPSYPRDPFESNVTSPMVAHAIDRIERRLDEFTSLVNMQQQQQQMQQGVTPSSSSSRRPSLSPMHPADLQGRGHSSRAPRMGQRESVAHVDPRGSS